MIRCNSYPTLNGCSNCHYLLSDDKQISLLTSECMIDLLAEMSTILTSCSQNKVLLDKSTLSCTGEIHIIYDDNTNFDYNAYNKLICSKILHSWLNGKVNNIDESMNTVYLVLCASLLHRNESEQISHVYLWITK